MKEKDLGVIMQSIPIKIREITRDIHTLNKDQSGLSLYG